MFFTPMSNPVALVPIPSGGQGPDTTAVPGFAKAALPGCVVSWSVRIPALKEGAMLTRVR